MATISDQLANSIQQCFDRTYVDLANQQQFLFGAGNVTITKPDGTTGTIKSWAQFQSEYATRQTNIDTEITAAKKDQAKTNVVQTFTASQTFGEGVTFSKTTTFTGAATFTGSATFNAQTTEMKDLDASGRITSRNGLELYHATPFIDFHFGNSTADYTARLIQSDANTMQLLGVHLAVARDIYVNGTMFGLQDNVLRRANWSGTVGVTQSTPSHRCRMDGRGAYSDSAGAWAGFYFEEQVGTEHRMIFMMDGFGKNATMIFRSDRSLEMDTIRLNNGRTRFWTGINSNYLELSLDGSARGINFFDSDERKKERILDVAPGRASEVISQIRPVSFKYKDSHPEGADVIAGKSYEFGVIAQEFEKLCPSGVTTMSDGMKSLDPLAVIGLLLAHNKELEERLKALEGK